MSEEPWTTVTPRKSRSKRTHAKPATATIAPPTALSTPSPRPPSPTTTQQLLVTVATHRTHFARSAYGAALAAVLSRERARRPGTVFARAVCVGLGSVARDEPALRRRSLWQLAAFLEVAVGMLGVCCSGGDVVVQDPAFGAVDCALFEALGVRVVRVPRARECVSRECFLFAPFLEGAVLLESVLPGTDPALYIGCEDLAEMKYQPFPESNVERMREVAREFMANRTEVKITEEFEVDKHIFAGLSMYWRSLEDDESKETIDDSANDSS